MGTGHMNSGYKGNASHFHTLTENLERLTEKFPCVNGYFGPRPKERSGKASIRVIRSDDPLREAKDFYERLAYGGKETPLKKDNGEVYGWRTDLADGTVLILRPVSSSSDKSPAVSLDISRSRDNGSIKSQKIHFVKE